MIVCNKLYMINGAAYIFTSIKKLPIILQGNVRLVFMQYFGLELEFK